MSLCFLEAFEEKQKGNITEQEYFHHLFAHCLGIEHERDESLNIDWDLHDADPFGYSVRCWTRRMDHVKGNSIRSPAEVLADGVKTQLHSRMSLQLIARAALNKSKLALIG
jgi:hypothetical protein